jgi:hypothetical protein
MMPAAIMNRPKMVKSVPSVKPGIATAMIPKIIPRIPLRINICPRYIQSHQSIVGRKNNIMIGASPF